MTRTEDFEALPTREKIIQRGNKPVAQERSDRSKAWAGKRDRKVGHRCQKVSHYLHDE